MRLQIYKTKIHKSIVYKKNAENKFRHYTHIKSQTQ